MRTIPSSFSPSSSLAPAAATSSLSSVQRSPWHSPIPYLFGGLAAMLGLITFALLILACSYWKLSGFLQSEEGSGRDLESVDAQKQSDSANKETVKVFEEKILVIMAGDENPTFLATPVVCSKPSSFGDGACKVGVDDHERLRETGDGDGVRKPPRQATTKPAVKRSLLLPHFGCV